MDASGSATTLNLLQRATAGDQQAIDELFARYAPALNRWASGRLPKGLRDIADTQDIVQDAMLQTFRNFRGFEYRGEGGSAPNARPSGADEVGKRLLACVDPLRSRRRSIRNATVLSGFAAAVFFFATAPLHLSSKAFGERARSLDATGEPIWSFDAGGSPSGAPSLDGHYFACNGFQSPVAICDVTAGIVRRITITERWREVFNARPLISPDGQLIVYHGLDLEEAKIVDVSTLASRSLRVDPAFFLKIIDWRASGDSLVVVLSPVGGGLGSSVALLDIKTGTLTDLKRFDAIPDSVALSHEGSLLAFTQRGHLYITDLLSGETRDIAGAFNVHGSLVWMRNDEGVLFTSGDPASELLLTRLAGGRPIGKIEILRHSSGLHFSLLGTTASGEVYYNATGFAPRPTTLYTAPFDMATQQTGAPSAIAMLPSRLSMDWSPDSRSIAYALADEARPAVVIRNAATALERRIELPDNPLAPPSPYLRAVRLIRWSPDSKILAYTGSSGRYLVELDPTSVRRIELPWDIANGSVEWAGSTVLSSGKSAVRGFDVDTGLQTESYSLPESVSSVEISPQQRLVAFSKTQGRAFEIDVSPLDANVPSALVVTDRRCRPVGWWNRDVFVACDDDSKALNLSPLYLVDIASGTMKAVHLDLQRIGHVRVRPDGRALAVTAGWTTSGTFVLKVPNR